MSSRREIDWHDTLQSVATRLEAFADDFERLARTPEQRGLADKFSDFVKNFVHERLSMPALGELASELDAFYLDEIDLALADELIELGESAGQAWEAWMQPWPMAKQKHTVEGDERQLLREIHELTSRQFVREDLWCGMVPFDGKLTELQTGPPKRFADLHWRDQADVLREFIHWDRYPERDWHDNYTIRENIEAGKPLEQWLEGTSLRQSFQHLAEGKIPPPVQREPEIRQEDLANLLFGPGNPEPAPAPEKSAREPSAFPMIRFQGGEYSLDFSQHYPNGRPAIVLQDRDGEHFATATVNVPEAQLKPNQVLIKDYSENHGMLQALEEAGIIKVTGQYVHSGFATIPVCELLAAPPSQQRSGHDQRSTQASAGALSAALFGHGADAPKESPEIQKESQPHDRGGRGR